MSPEKRDEVIEMSMSDDRSYHLISYDGNLNKKEDHHIVTNNDINDRLESPNIIRLTPAPILREYVEMMNPISESPLEFHAVTMIHIISCIMGRNFYIKQGKDRIFPNLYTLVVAPSSEYHKTSAVKMLYSYLSRIDWTGHFLGMIGSPEGMLKRLEKSPCNGTGHLYYSEFGQLLSSLGKGHMADTLDILNDLFDCPDEWKKALVKGEYKVKNGCISILGATQLESLSRNIKEDQLLTGFLPRFLICYSIKLGNPIIWRNDEDRRLDDGIINKLTQIKDSVSEIENSITSTNHLNYQARQFEVCPEAIDVLKQECLLHRQIRNRSENRIKTMYGRFETLILKLAMIIHIAKLEFDNLTISETVMKQAIGISAWHSGNYKQLLSEIPTGSFSKKMLRAEKILKELKVVKMRDMSRRLSMKKNAVLNLMDILIDDGECEFDEEENCFKLLQ